MWPKTNSCIDGEQNIYTRSKELVGDRSPRNHEFSIQLRSLDNDKCGTGLGMGVPVALAGSLPERNTLGGYVEMLPNPVAIAELAVEKQAHTLLMPVSARKALNDLPDEMWTKIKIEFYGDPADAVFKALED